MLGFHVGTGHLNSGLHACMASPQPILGLSLPIESTCIASSVELDEMEDVFTKLENLI